MTRLTGNFIPRALMVVGLGIVGLQVSAWAQLPPVPSTDLGVTSNTSAPGTTDPGPVIGAARTFVPVTITVTNHGPDATDGDVIVTMQPKGLKILTDIDGICTVSHGSQGSKLILCNFGPMASNASIPVTLFFSDGAGNDNFFATVTGPDNDDNSANDKAPVFLTFI